MGPFNGYILTRTFRDRGNRHELCYAGTGEQGPFEIVITRNRPVFFIPRETQLPDFDFSVERKSVDLTSFNNTPVDALYFSTQNHLYKARTLLEEKGIRTYEDDIRPEERYLMERFIYGEISFEGPSTLRRGLARFIDPRITPARFQPNFSLLSLDIETGQRGQLYSIAVDFVPARNMGRRWGQVFMVDPQARWKDQAPESLEGGGELLRLPREADVIRAFLDLFVRMDPDIIVGWHVVGFDLAFLEEKCRSLGLYFNLGRDGSPLRIREVRKGSFHASVHGRIVIDGPPALRNAFYSFENFRLETVAQALLETGKDIDESGDKVKEIERRFRKDKPALARYNLMDARLVTDIFERTGLTDLTFKRAVISGLPMDRVGYSVAAFEHYMLPRIHRRGLVAPNVRNLSDRGHAAGGLVFATEPGFYRQIGVFDFKSLYPSIIRTFNIDPLSRLKAAENPVNTPMDIAFSRSDHVLPDYIAQLLAQREGAKAQGDVHLSQAVKILMNSFYGVMGTMGCRFYHPDQSRAITGTGQWILKTTRSLLEERGYRVIYGDTDSVFVCLDREDATGGGDKAGPVSEPGDTVEEGDRPNGHTLPRDGKAPDWDALAGELAREINGELTRILKAEFDVVSHLELEYEKRFTRFFLPALRGGGDGAKKRYAGMVAKGEGTELVFTGLEFVRTDWTRFARNFQYQLFSRIFQDEEVGPWIRQTVAELKEGGFDRDLVYKKRLTKPAAEYIKVVPPHVKAALMLGPDPPREILYVITQRGPVPVELPHDDLDYDHYVQRQLKPIADAVLLFFDQDFSQVMGGRQMDLF